MDMEISHTRTVVPDFFEDYYASQWGTRNLTLRHARILNRYVIMS